MTRRPHPRAAAALAVLVALAGPLLRPVAAATDAKVLVIGFDGMDPQLLERFVGEGAMPNFARLMKQGDYKRLATAIPPQSPVAWADFITGMDPGGHGIFDFVHRNLATRMPMSSMSEVTEPTRTLTIGPYVLPLAGGGVRSLREGRAFWQTLADQGIAARVIRMPANFPPADCEQESLAGMGTPDMTGTAGTFSFFTNDPAEQRMTVAGGNIARAKIENGRATLHIEGPPNSLRKDHVVTVADLTVHIDPTEPVARMEMQGQQFILRQGEWSEWVRASFRLLPGVKSASGILRVYLQQAHPYLRIYVSPVNIDPADPAMPISTPPSHSRQLAEALGPFYTQ